MNGTDSQGNLESDARLEALRGLQRNREGHGDKGREVLMMTRYELKDYEGEATELLSFALKPAPITAIRRDKAYQMELQKWRAEQLKKIAKELADIANAAYDEGNEAPRESTSY